MRAKKLLNVQIQNWDQITKFLDQEPDFSSCLRDAIDIALREPFRFGWSSTRDVLVTVDLDDEGKILLKADFYRKVGTYSHGEGMRLEEIPKVRDMIKALLDTEVNTELLADAINSQIERDFRVLKSPRMVYYVPFVFILDLNNRETKFKVERYTTDFEHVPTLLRSLLKETLEKLEMENMEA